MRANRRRDTLPERRVRSLLHAMGLRYRVDQPIRDDLPRPVRPDITFSGVGVAVFIDGCFWHGCPKHGRRRQGPNSGYWGPKIARNRERDIEQQQRLENDNWLVLRFWEHEDATAVAAVIARTVQARRSSGSA